MRLIENFSVIVQAGARIGATGHRPQRICLGDTDRELSSPNVEIWALNRIQMVPLQLVDFQGPSNQVAPQADSIGLRAKQDSAPMVGVWARTPSGISADFKEIEHPEV